jgi:hypothetical protein
VTLERRHGAANGLHEVALVVALDEVRDGLRVGLGGEDVTLVRETGPELAIVLDDAVQHDRDALGLAAGERMRVLLGDRTVRRPARVAQPGRRGRAVRARRLPQVLEVPDRADVLEPVRLEEGEAGGVVPPVLEPLETLQEQRLALARPDVSDDPADGDSS